MTDSINCHFVTRELTQPWELKERYLKYFDFPSNKFGQEPSRYLFSKEDLNSAEMEGLLNRLVEQPIQKFKKDLQTSETPLQINYFNTFRALHLYFLIQSTRYAKFLDNQSHDSNSLLEQTLLKGEDFLNQLVAVRQQTYDLRIFQIPAGRALCFPITGYFAFPIQDEHVGLSFGYAVPIFPSVALTITPKTVLSSYISEIQNGLDVFSVGLDQNCPRVILPPDLVNQFDEETIRNQMLKFREVAIAKSAATAEYRTLVSKLYNIFGISLKNRK